jgi:exodeoxyribonuclease V beta subunit
MIPAGTVRYRKPPQLAELGARHAVVEASAGTGKTYILEHLVVDLILTRGASVDQILVVTFTEKATAELGTRIRRKLDELLHLEADHANAAGADDDACWLIDGAARQRLGDALLGFDRAAISTIHGFCQRLLTEHAFLHRRLFREEAVAEDEAFATAFAEVLRREPAGDAQLAELLSLWLEAGNALGKLRRAVAAAVRGVSCLFPRRPEALRPDPFEPTAVIAAAQAVAAAPAGEALKIALKRAKVHHSTIGAIIDKWGELRVLAGGCTEAAAVPRLLTDVDVFDRRRDDALGYLYKKLDPAWSDPELRPAVAAFRQFIAAVPPPLAALVTRLVPAVVARLESNKREAGRFDFQDMLTLVAEGLQGEGARQRALVSTLRARYRYALIDEFQDTDEVQWGIFRKIFFDSPDGHVLTVIGDPKQAIYAFRGADVFTYLDARQAIEGAGGARVFLTENFRSTAPLIGAYNAILDQAAPFFRPEGGILYDHPVTCGSPQLELRDAAGGPASGLVILDVETEARSLLTWQVKRGLLARIAREVQALLAPGAGLRFGPQGRTTPVEAGDIYVLTRTTRESREVGEALRAVGVPFAFFKQEKLFDTVEARDLLDLLRAVADPDDVTARARAFITPFFSLGLADLASCDDLDPGDPLLRLLYDWRALAEAGDFETLFARIVAGSGVVCRNLFFRDSERSLTNTLHLIEILQEEAARSRTTIRELCATLGAFIAGTRRPPGEGRDIQRLETEAAAVQIMTIHHSKGLEAAVVFVYGGFWPGPGNDVRVIHDQDGHRLCDVGRATPDAAAAYTAEQEDEERRVLYVALTRGKARLYLPRYPAAFKNLRGAYRFVNDRLHALLGGFSDPEILALFRRDPIACPGEALPPLLPASPAVLAAWAPPPELLLRPPMPVDRVALGHRRAGFVTTSYSALKRTAGSGFVPAQGLPDDFTLEEERRGDLGDDAGPQLAVEPRAGEGGEPRATAPVVLGPGDLPRGRVTGRFLHALLEELPLGPALGDADWQAWAARPENELVFDRIRRRYDLSPVFMPAAQQLVHTALTAPVQLGPTLLPGFARAARALRELEFIYPIPERHHRLLADLQGAPALAAEGTTPAAAGFTIGRGIIKGYIDLLFEHDGLVYLCDWKGDWLPDWNAETVSGHVQRNYTLQARLYTLGVARFLGLESPDAWEQRWGGVVYAFVRGMSPADPSRGIYFSRPSFKDLLGWQTEWLDDRFWGLR